MFETGKLNSEPGCYGGSHLIAVFSLPYCFLRSESLKLAVRPWVIAYTTTANGSKDGPDTSFPCRCIDVDDRTTFRAHSHAVILNEFQCINTNIDSDIMSASMKDQFFGDVDKLQQRFVLQLRKLARRWKVQGSSFNADSQPILSELFDEHRSNVQGQAHWTSESLQHTAHALTTCCHSCGSFPFACSRDLPNLVFHSVAQNLLHRRGICILQGASRILSRRSRDYDTSSTTTALCVGATTSCTPSYSPHSAQTDQGLAQSETNHFFLSHVGSSSPDRLWGPHL